MIKVRIIFKIDEEQLGISEIYAENDVFTQPYIMEERSFTLEEIQAEKRKLIVENTSDAIILVEKGTGVFMEGSTLKNTGLIDVENGVGVDVFLSDDINMVHDGGLADIAPTMLHILGLEKPCDMTGHSLV